MTKLPYLFFIKKLPNSVIEGKLKVLVKITLGEKIEKLNGKL